MLLVEPQSDASLKAILDAFVLGSDGAALARSDPVELVRHYGDPHDQEVVGLIVAALAYGRVASIKASASKLLERLGSSPAASVDSGHAVEAVRGFVYRFQKGDDLARFVTAIARVRHVYGSLAGAFVAVDRGGDPDYAETLDRFVRLLRDQFDRPPSYGLSYLLPRGGTTGGAAKRLCLYLRWMIRPHGEQDLGAWRTLTSGAVDSARLIIPLDTHIQRIARYIGLTERKTHGMKTAREITAALRRLRPDDPLVYDIALCHLGISGRCPRKRDVEKCVDCPIRSACRLGDTPKGWDPVSFEA